MFIQSKWSAGTKSPGRRESKDARLRSSDRRVRPALESLDQRLVPATGVSANFAVTNAWPRGSRRR
jgi:hypothetical protein